jgi:TRAP-type C4-dicarboxylate transport system permease small subunit
MNIDDDPSGFTIAENGSVEESAPPRQGPLATAAFILGTLGLAIATATDALAVAGRHLGFTILGSIEIVQAAIVLIASAAMVGTTVAGRHAAVHIVTGRLAPSTSRRLARIAAAVSAALFIAILVGSVWVAADLWHGFEQTELLRIPLRWLRALWIAAALLIAALFARAAIKRSGS